MFKHIILLTSTLFLLSACAERGVLPTVPTVTTSHAEQHAEKKHLSNTNKSVTPAHTPVKAITVPEKSSEPLVDTIQNNIAGLMVLAVALALIL